MKKLDFFLFSACFLLAVVVFAQRGKHGNVTVNTVNRIVNEYTALTADAAAGATTITVAASSLNANNRFSTSLVEGDLIMIIQMQGVTLLGQPDSTFPFFSNPDNVTWGEIINYNNCGNYELRQVASVPGGTSIELDCGLEHDYTAAGRVQVVRVPRYNSLTITAPGVLTCDAWDGVVGGILAIEVKENTVLNTGAKMNVSGKGFRGAALYTPGPSRSQFPWFSSINTEMSANKGEGVAGSGADLIPYGGQYGRGAAANAGGAGNVWNCGGGGGANAGAVNGWTGQGNPDVSNPSWAAAWNLEAPGFATSTSSGGGRGGYSFSADDKDATVDPPDNNAWGGYARRNFGGIGGRPLDYSTGRIFMGGGGGGGEQDNNQGGAGGNGGGIIYFCGYGNFSIGANDSLLADGSRGGDSYVTPPLTSYSGKDGAGGGGGGGTILINCAGFVYNCVLSARGGRGGDQVLTSGSLYFGEKNEAEGPGGGGGGGYIALTSGNPQQIVTGGRNGTTNSDGMTEFPANGATRGGDGFANQVLPTVQEFFASSMSGCAGDTVTLVAPGLTWYDSLTGGNVIGFDTLILGPLTGGGITVYVGSCPGTYRHPVLVMVLPNVANVFYGAPLPPGGPYCEGEVVIYNVGVQNGGTNPTFQWYVNGQPEGINENTFTSSTLSDGDSVYCVMTPVTGCAAGNPDTTETIVVDIVPIAIVAVSIAAAPGNELCAGTTASFTATPANGGTDPVYQWQLNGVNTGTDSSLYVNSSLSNGDVISCIMTSNASCIQGSPDTSNVINMIVNPLPVPAFTSDINSGCHLPLCVQFSETSGNTYASLTYDFGDGNTAATANAQNCFIAPGNYSVSLTVVDSNNCSGSTVIGNMVIVTPEPEADFTFSPAEAIVANTPVTFTNASANNNTSAWNFGDSLSGGNVSVLVSPSHVYTAAGTYCVDLVVMNLSGCADSVTKCFTVTNESKVVVPNMFTPNGDGKNDVFFITTNAVKELSCSIYDRWGLKVAEWEGVTKGWDGLTIKGKAAQDGVYYYIVKTVAADGKEATETGFLQLLKE
jgi:gliding motility-associated-like protein